MSKEPTLEHPEEENAKPPRQTWRILFLDSSDKIELLKGACKEAGYVVVGASTIEEAWAFLDGKDHADVIVCAAHLEDESMFDFLKGVRENDAHRDTIFIILSLEASATGTRLERSTETAGAALGADAYVVMPVLDPCELIAQIRMVQPAVPMLQRVPPDERRRSE